DTADVAIQPHDARVIDGCRAKQLPGIDTRRDPPAHLIRVLADGTSRLPASDTTRLALPHRRATAAGLRRTRHRAPRPGRELPELLADTPCCASEPPPESAQRPRPASRLSIDVRSTCRAR